MIKLHNLIKAGMIACLMAFTACGGNEVEPGPIDETVAVTGVTLDKPTAVLAPGQTIQLTHEVAPSDATDKTVTWKSSDEAVASVDDKGMVTAHEVGEAKITVSTTDGNQEAYCQVEVTYFVTGVSLNTATLSIMKGFSETLTATVEPEEAINKEVTWATSNSGIVSIDPDGLTCEVTGVAKGKATITVKTVDGEFEDYCEVTVGLDGVHPFGDIFFRTDDVKTIGTQTWSDVVIASGCLKDDFDGGELILDDEGNVLEYAYKVDCRQNTGYGHLFSWEAINQYGEYLCPTGQDWRVPTAEEFIALDRELTGTSGVRLIRGHLEIFLSEWGATYGGYAHAGKIYSQGSWGRYWSITGHEMLAAVGHALYVKNDGEINSVDYGDKAYGMMLRCVK